MRRRLAARPHRDSATSQAQAGARRDRATRPLAAHLRQLQEVGHAEGHGVVLKEGDVEDKVGWALKRKHNVATPAGAKEPGGKGLKRRFAGTSFLTGLSCIM